MDNESYKEEDSARQMFENIDWFDNTREGQVDGQLTTILDENFGNCLYDMHRFAKAVSSDDCMGYAWEKNKFNKIILTPKKHSTYFCLLNQFIHECCRLNGRAPSEYSQLVFDGLMALKICDFQFSKPGLMYIDGQYEADLFNSLIVWIRDQARKKDFIKKISDQEYRETRNFKSATSYFEKLISKYADLLIIRVDLSYREELAGKIDIETAKNDFKRLLNNRRSNTIFEATIGYIAKLEMTPKKWLHFHVVFFFNGAKRKKHEWIAEQIGKYWVDFITPGRGLFHNCNRHKYDECGIGKLHYSDRAKRDIFISRVIRYVTKADNYIRAYFGGDLRLFFKGIIHTGGSTAGRPRLVSDES